MLAMLLTTLCLAEPALPKAGELKQDVKFDDLGPLRVSAADAQRHHWPTQFRKLNLEKETFTVLVPKSYDPKEKYGLVVYISPTDRGILFSNRMNREKFAELLDDMRVLYVGANRSGNDRNPLERLQLALTAAANMAKHYPIDPDRVAVVGFSGGGKMACLAGRYAPDLFSGVVAICGCGYHANVSVPGSGGRIYPKDMELSKDEEDLARRNVSFVFITGPKDFNYQPTILIKQAYLIAKFNAMLLDVPDLGHEIPGDSDLRRALEVALKRPRK
jgi:predicted esterase